MSKQVSLSAVVSPIASRRLDVTRSQHSREKDFLLSDSSWLPLGWSWEYDMTRNPPKWIMRLREPPEVIDIIGLEKKKEQAAEVLFPVRRSVRLNLKAQR